ncbi:MAG TPA: DUF5694 domain-containing protein [Gemmatimonadaceae bacterium]|nr:DUF5694 domain-containing protein [Gemmatimonadaceae bacterium]
MQSRTRVGLAALWAVSAIPALAQETPAAKPAGTARAEVFVLGVYHMANPGRDIFNMHADDVLAPKRQAEIAQVIAALKKFRPTKIAVEADVGDDRVPKRYEEYLAGKHELTSNEVEQLGFRLAKELGHKTVYPADADGDFPFQRVVDYAKASGRSKELDAMMGEVGAMVKAQNDYLASHTVLETLLYMNADEKVTEDVGFYYREAHYGEPGDWAGADLVSEWFKRNMRIYSNVVQLVDSPSERVLVIFGAGHLGWLQHDFSSDPTLRLRKLAEFAK